MSPDIPAFDDLSDDDLEAVLWWLPIVAPSCFGRFDTCTEPLASIMFEQRLTDPERDRVAHSLATRLGLSGGAIRRTKRWQSDDD